MINLVLNDDFANGAWGWEASPGLELTVDVTDLGSEDQPVLLGRAEAGQRTGLVGLGARPETYAPVIGGQTFEVGAYTRAQYGAAELSVIWLDEGRTPLASSVVPVIRRALAGPSGGSTLGFDEAYARLIAPPGSVYAKLGLSGRTATVGDFLLLLSAPRIDIVYPD